MSTLFVTQLMYVCRPQDPITISSLSEAKHSDAVVHPSNSSVRFDLFRWTDNQCPVDYFVISYKKADVSNHIRKYWRM